MSFGIKRNGNTGFMRRSCRDAERTPGPRRRAKLGDRMTVTYILLGFFACAAAMLALGISAVRVLRLPLNRLECLCLGYVLGAPLASTLVLALASLWVARKGVFFAIGILSAVLLWRQLPWLRGLKPAPLDTIPVFFKRSE